MWETAIVILTVLAAVMGVGYGLYRSASGKFGCAGCSGCGRTSNPEVADRTRGACHAEGK
jgi:hypothetical protein